MSGRLSVVSVCVKWCGVMSMSVCMVGMFSELLSVLCMFI